MYLIGNGMARIRANSAVNTIEELQNKLTQLFQSAKTIETAADAEKRALTDEEEREIKAIMDAFDGTKQEIARRQRLLDQERDLSVPQPRQALPMDAPMPQAPPPRLADAPTHAVQRHSPITGGELVGTSRGTYGWRSFGEFAQGVRKAVRGSVDPRLVMNAPTTFGNEGTGADGGFAVPPDFRTGIVQKVFGEESLLSRTDQQVSSSNSMTVPVDETTPWQTSGGIQTAWEGEGHQKAQSKPALENRNVRLNKLASIIPITDELMEDAPALSAYLKNKVAEKMTFKINDAIINGDGVGKPLGLMNSGALVSVAEDDDQDAATITFANITRMWARLYAMCRRNAVWLTNQDVEPQLASLRLEGSSGGIFPMYMPPGGLSGQPYATLMGRPIIATEACATLGTTGDIILADLSTYLAIVKSTGGIAAMRQDVSMHLWFDFDVTAFRFVMRVGGMPWWQAPIVRAGSNTNTLSCFVKLDTRAG